MSGIRHPLIARGTHWGWGAGYKVSHTLGACCAWSEAGTSPFVYPHGTYVGGTACKLLHTTLLHFCAVAWTVSKSSARRRWDIETWFHFNLSRACFVHDVFNPAESHATCCGDKILFQYNIFLQNRQVMRGKQSMHWACPRKMFLSFFWPLNNTLSFHFHTKEK